MAIAEEVVASASVENLDVLYARILDSEAKLVGSDGRSRGLPSDLAGFLRELAGDLMAGRSVSLLQENAELTTAEAAKLLSVSRQFFVQLLEQGQIAFHMVGTHRRVYARDLLAYRGKRDVERRKVLSDLVRAEVAEGIYDLVPLHAADSE